MRMLVRLAVSRGWRAILVSDCGAEGKGVLEFKGLGGIWLVVVNAVAELFWIQEWPTCGGSGEKRHDAPDGRSMAVVIPCAGRGFRGRRLMVRFLGLGLIKRDELCSIVFQQFWVSYLFVRFGL